MPRFNKFQRALRRFGCLRKLVLIDLQKTRLQAATSLWNYERSVLSNIGLYVSTWAGIERMLNEFIVQYHPHRAGNLRDHLPSNLESKIKYLASISADDRLPLNLRNSIKNWVTDLSQQKEYRHLLVHGIGHHKRLRTRFEWSFQKLHLKGTEAILIEKTFDNDEIQRRLKDISDLSHSIAGILTPILHPAHQTSSTNRP